MSKKDTWSLCKECYGIVPASLEFSSPHGAVLTKTCLEHGEQAALVDPSVEFYEWMLNAPQASSSHRPGLTALNVTNRCNVRCPGCYHLPDNSGDRELDPIIREAARATKGWLGLMGAEPTMREDLSELILALKKRYDKPVLLYTNGIKLEDQDYTAQLAATGLDLAAVSLHLSTYLGEKSHRSKLEGLKNLKKSSITLDHLAFSLRDMGDVPETLKLILELGPNYLQSSYVRVRAPSALGGKRNTPAHLSEMIECVLRSCFAQGFKAEVMPFTNHIYAIMLKIEEYPVMFVRWPTAEEADLGEAQKGPVRALFVPEAGETQILHQALLIERVRSGLAFPPSPPKECPDAIAGRAV